MKQPGAHLASKIVLCLLAFFLWAGASYFGVLGLIRAFSAERSLSEVSRDAKNTIHFSNVDETENIFENERYLERDRTIRFGTESSNAALTEENCASYGEYAVLFFEYFQAILYGDETAYAEFFTPSYKAQNNLPKSFTMQKLYDVLITEYRDETIEETDESPVSAKAFLVQYRILENNGTFRDDLPSGASQKQYYRIVEDESGTLLIRDIFAVREAAIAESDTDDFFTRGGLLYSGISLLCLLVPLILLLSLRKRRKKWKSQ